MREIALIVICLIAASVDFYNAREEKKANHTGGTILMSALGVLSVVCVIINAYILFTK